jgi:hypothetical protein
MRSFSWLPRLAAAWRAQELIGSVLVATVLTILHLVSDEAPSAAAISALPWNGLLTYEFVETNQRSYINPTGDFGNFVTDISMRATVTVDSQSIQVDNSKSRTQFRWYTQDEIGDPIQVGPNGTACGGGTSPWQVVTTTTTVWPPSNSLTNPITTDETSDTIVEVYLLGDQTYYISNSGGSSFYHLQKTVIQEIKSGTTRCKSNENTTSVAYSHNTS